MELGPLSDIASEPGVTDIAVTSADGTVWVDRGQGMRPYTLRVPFANSQAIRCISPYDCARSSAEGSTTHAR